MPADETLPAAPPKDCGDVANDATNCGFCGHSCQGGTCTNGLCSTTVVARSSSRIGAFATDGVDVFTIESHAARACSIPAGTPDTCREIVTGDQLGQRLTELSRLIPDWNGWGGGGGPGGPKKGIISMPALSPTAIALRGDRVFIADDEYEVLLSCPSKTPCTSAAMGLVHAESRDDDDDDDSSGMGRSLALTSSTIVWTAGDAIRAAFLPDPGDVETPFVSRRDATTDKTARVAAPGETDLLWLSEKGLHYANDPNVRTPEVWFSQPAVDFSFDDERVYLAASTGLFRVSRKDKSASLAATGNFGRVAVDAKGVFAAMADGSRTWVVEARAGELLRLAVVDGPIDELAVVGDHVYFMTRVGEGSEIHRVPR